MSSFVLTWNPESQWTGDPRCQVRWATGNRTSGIFRGDHLFLLRQGTDQGVVAFGLAMGPIFQARGGRGWTDPDAIHNFVPLAWEVLIIDNYVPIDALAAAAPGFYWRPPASGHEIKQTDAQAVARLIRGALRLPG